MINVIWEVGNAIECLGINCKFISQFWFLITKFNMSSMCFANCAINENVSLIELWNFTLWFVFCIRRHTIAESV